jgi:hypothetical protein
MAEEGIGEVVAPQKKLTPHITNAKHLGGSPEDFQSLNQQILQPPHHTQSQNHLLIVRKGLEKNLIFFVFYDSLSEMSSSKGDLLFFIISSHEIFYTKFG